MRKQDFHVDIPNSLIASEPLKERSLSRLLALNPRTANVEHLEFYQLVDKLNANDCLIFNNTKVIPARLFGNKSSGGKVEILVERIIPQEHHDEFIAQLKASNKPKIGNIIHIAVGFSVEVISLENNFFRLRALEEQSLLQQIEKHGLIPLPPYIKRTPNESDKHRYQTVYAQKLGAVAAPTAGLHFDQELITKIKSKGIQSGFVTLHVGAGTFSPIRVDEISEHQMHSEWFEVHQDVVDLVKSTRDNGGRVIAIGTTSVRCLESASSSGQLVAASGETDIFIFPGYQFKSVDALITNFHLSESTLLMLVCAFAGQSTMLQTYRTAVELNYRFFSYGDAMFIEHQKMPPIVSNT